MLYPICTAAIFVLHPSAFKGRSNIRGAAAAPPPPPCPFDRYILNSES